MTALLPVLRLTVFAPPSVDATELTPLTPAAGAPHAEAFRVATAEGITGFRPYLQFPDGRRGAFDVLTKRLTAGELTYRLLDRRTGDSNLARWLTAFAGDSDARPILLNCRVLAELSLDGGATWDDFHTGRLEDVGFDDPLMGTLTVRDETDRLEEQQFVGPPHASIAYARAGAVLPVQLPVGLRGTRTVFKGTVDHLAKPRAFSVFVANDFTAERGNVASTGLTALATREGEVGYDEESGSAINNAHFFTFGTPVNRATVGTDYFLGRSRLRAIVTWSGGSGEYAVSSVFTKRQEDDHYWKAWRLQLWEYESGERGYATRPPDSTVCSLVLVNDGPATKHCPLILTEADPLQLWQDVLDGKFAQLAADGSVRRTMPYDAAAFTALAAARTFLPIDAVLTEPMAATDFIERFLLKPYHLGYRLDAAGAVVPFDCRRETTLASVPVLGLADLARPSDGFSWRQRRSDAVSAIRLEAYRDIATPIATQVRTGRRPVLEAAAGALASYPITIFDADLSPRALDVTGGELVIDAPGWRVRDRLTDDVAEQDRAGAIEAAALGLGAQLRILVGPGSSTLVRAFRRTTAGDIYPGMWRRLQVPEAPNSATYERGGERLGFCVDRIEQGLSVVLTFLEGGAVTTADVPTLTDLAITQQIPRVEVTLNAAGDPVLFEYAITVTSVGSPPTAGWRQAGTSVAAGTYSFPKVAPGYRLWVRGRSEPAPSGSTFRLPSAFAAPTPAFVDTGTVTAPSGVTLSVVEKNAATVSWTNGDATRYTEVLIALGSYSGSLFDVGGLVTGLVPPGGTSFRLLGLDGPSVAHCVGVRHFGPDDGGRSAIAYANFTTGTTNTARPRPAGIAIASPLL